MTSTRVLSTAFGFMMVAAVAVQADKLALVAAVVGAVAVLASIQLSRATTAAVIACVVAIALSDPNPLLATLAGLNATGYLLLRHAGARESLTRPTLVAVLGLSALGLVATTLPVELPWAPLLAPFAVLAVFVIAIRPLIGAGRRTS
jgi:hypothetical protein